MKKKFICIWCNEKLSYRGFCSEKCHNAYYDSLGENDEESNFTNKELVDMVLKIIKKYSKTMYALAKC